MNRKLNAAAAGLTATAALGLVGCSGASAPTAWGRLDDVKHVTKLTKPATRTVSDYRQQCTIKTRTVTRTTGSGKTRSTSTSTQPYQDCHQVFAGTHVESYTKTVRDEKWCVELDNVNHKSDVDDQWFTVSQGTYLRWVGRNEGAKVKRLPYLHKGC